MWLSAVSLTFSVKSSLKPFEISSIAREQKGICWLAMLAKHLQHSNLDRSHTFLLPRTILPTLGQNWVMTGSPCWLPGSRWIFYVRCMLPQRRDWQQVEPVSSCGWESQSTAMEASIKGSVICRQLFGVWIEQSKPWNSPRNLIWHLGLLQKGAIHRSFNVTISAGTQMRHCRTATGAQAWAHHDGRLT